jgi:hypothetical protein
MLALYSAAVRRLLVLLLLAVLPLQISWAAAFHCPQGGDGGAGLSVASAAPHAAHTHAHDGDESDDGHAAGAGLDCSVLQLVALEPPSAWLQFLARAGAIAHGVACPGYKSHIPDGLERPKWGLAV